MVRQFLFIFIFLSLNLFSSTLKFTDEEKAYIQKNPIVTIGSSDSYSPFSFLNNGRKEGFTQDLIDLIAKKSGLTFQRVDGTWPELFESFKASKIDIITEFSHKKEREAYTLYSDSYFNIPIGVFAKEDFGLYHGIESLKGKRVGVVKGSYIISFLKNIEDITIVQIESSDQRFHELSLGNVDVVISNAMSIYRIESMLYLKDIKLVGYFKYNGVKEEDLRFGIRKEKPLLASIIQKSLRSIAFSQMSALKQEWITQNHLQHIPTLNQKELQWIENNRLSVGIEHAKPYISYNKNKQNIEGLYADILQLVIEKTGLKVDYHAKPWNQLLQEFKDKQIDLLPATFYSKQRESFGRYSSSYYQVREYIYTLNNRFDLKSIDNLQYQKVAIVKGYATIQKIKEKYPNIKIIETDSLEASVTLVLNQEVDALIDYHLVVEDYIRTNSIVKLKAIAQNEFEATSVHFLSHIDKPILQSILQKGLAAISKDEKNELLLRWVREPYELRLQKNILSYKEQKFLKQHPTIRFRVRSDRPPFEFNNNGKPDGIAVDYVKKSAQNVGLKAEFVLNDDPIPNAYATIENSKDKYDTLLFSVKSNKRAARFAFGSAYLSYPLMIITHKDVPYVSKLKDLSGQTIVLEQGFLTNNWIKRDYPTIKIINVPSTKEALRMVNDKEVLAYVGNLGVTNYMALFEGMNNLKVSAPSGYDDIYYSFIAPKEWPELVSLLSKGYEKITPSEHTAIQQKWFSLQTIEKVDYKLIWEVVIGCALLILWFIWWNRKIVQERNKTQEALQQLQLSQEEQLRQQQVLLNQSKIASMGEMIGNIAHQWRQPLSVISITATGMKLKKELGLIDEKEFVHNMDLINTNAQYLSTTIDTFRNFIKEKKEYKKVILQERIHLALDIFGTSLKNQGIELITNIDKIKPIEMVLVLGELSQVIGNIIHNAKDALLEQRVKKPWIKIMIESSSNDLVVISIEDNAGGIDEKIMSKIFDPYFTTKHQSQGTGLGLHMSYKIIVESLQGKLYVQNSAHGAKFFIELPLTIQDKTTL